MAKRRTIIKISKETLDKITTVFDRDPITIGSAICIGSALNPLNNIKYKLQKSDLKNMATSGIPR